MKKVVTVIVSAMLWIIILMAALYAFTTISTRDSNNVSSVFGYTPLVVKSDSMAPTFKSGDLIFIKKCDTSKLEEGDIICFHTIVENEYSLNTHRIQKIDEANGSRSYTTIGDNNNGVADQHIISDGDIVGKYIGHWPKIGKVMDFLSSSVGFLVVIVLPMLLFFIYQVYNLIMINIRLKRAVAVENAKAAEEAKLAVADESAQSAMSEAEAKLAEAQRMRDEAEAIRRQAEEELAKAKDKNAGDEASAGTEGNAVENENLTENNGIDE